MEELQESLQILRNTPAGLRALVASLPASLTAADYGPGTFSVEDVVRHLILGERTDWLPRIRIVVEHGESLAFDPFPWDGRDEETSGASLSECLDVLERCRRDNLDALDALALTDDDLDRTGTHPLFGPVTIRQLIATWSAHDLHHVAQICKALNYQFRHVIGPWRPHLNSIPAEA